MSDLLSARDKLAEARSLVDLIFMAARDLEPEWSKPLCIGAMKASDILADIESEFDKVEDQSKAA